VGVDVARFKSEFLADYWRRKGLPLRARAIGNIHTLLGWGSVTPALATVVARSGIARRLGEMALGIDRRRAMPGLARSTFAREFGRRASAGRGMETESRGPRPTDGDARRSVVVFNDTFTNYCHPEIGIAATEVLDRAGIRVRLVPHACCGRPLISQGLLDEARRLAGRNAETLAGATTAGERIVFLEPSCLSAVREDAPALLRGDSRRQAQAVARQCVLFEELLEHEWRTGSIDLAFERALPDGPRTILLHGHCHQKAMGLVSPALALLARLPSTTVIDLDAGCCGMAGSFGYATEHYEVSRAIGERRLLPAARAMTPDSMLVASGTSCREQIAHFAGVSAIHPAVLLRSVLAEAPTAAHAREPR
jgi:Fe-S oxidoreductase